MSEKIVFVIIIHRTEEGKENGNEITAYNLDELNKLLSELESSFLISIKDHLLMREVSKDEYISYKNELGIWVKGSVKNYIIKNDLLEYLIRLNFLHVEKNDERGVFYPFYTKTLRAHKYIVDDIYFTVKVRMDIHNPHKDVDV